MLPFIVITFSSSMELYVVYPYLLAILFGIEPSYMYDPYICYCFDSEKENSYIHKGQDFGYYLNFSLPVHPLSKITGDGLPRPIWIPVILLRITHHPTQLI